MADWSGLGLMSGIEKLASGVNQGMITQANLNNIKNQQNMESALSGLTKNDDGSYSPTPQKQEQMQLQQAVTQRQLHQMDPTSAESQSARTINRGLLQSIPGFKGDVNSLVPDSASALDLKENAPLEKAQISGTYGMLGQQIKGNAMAGPRQEQADTAKDNQTAHAVDLVTNDKQLSNHLQRIQGANRILSQLDAVKSGKIVDTNQLLNDVNTEYVNLLTGANNSALGKQERTEYTTMAGNIADTIQKIKGSPESINSPEIESQLESQVRDLQNLYKGQYSSRGAALQRAYQHNPEATRAQADKIQELINENGAPPSGGGLLGPSGGGQDPQIAKWASQYGYSYDAAAKIINARKSNGQQ